MARSTSTDINDWSENESGQGSKNSRRGFPSPINREDIEPADLDTDSDESNTETDDNPNPTQKEVQAKTRTDNDTNTKILTAMLIQRHFDEVILEYLRDILTTLADIIVEHNIKTLRISKHNDLTDKITFSIFLDILNERLKHCDCTIYICYGTCTIPSKDIRKNIISEYHDSLVGGHRGVTKTYKRIREKFYWNGIKSDVTEYIRNCQRCQELKLVRVINREPMIITDTPIEPFDKISIDTVGPLPATTDGNKNILTIQDNLTKYFIVVPIPNTKAETIADALARYVIATYGAPKVILSDKAPALIGKQVNTSGYHPQTNGSLERNHLVLVEYICQYLNEFEDWDKVLPFAVFSYNTSVHESTNFTPYELIFGRPARSPTAFPNSKNETYTSYMTDLINRMNHIRKFASKNLIDSKYKSKRYYDRSAKSSNYEIGDLVYVIKEPRKNKLDKMYKGPYQVVGVLEQNNPIPDLILLQMKLELLILSTLPIAGTYETKGYAIQEIPHNPGIYYERMEDIRFTQAD
ncbi:hypothetical protein TSAR_015460 [Trichomalopsis sarcophagae]|uniref:RNA-directed DNA polymerase n=1 Tax=Trichomalopsis sarcophagae TaxID=543379 RepID=A0A232EHG2_9HYME|nr:hypothetical protein TSAR_015460 [Trichomalopsis sarcophagae]